MKRLKSNRGASIVVAMLLMLVVTFAAGSIYFKVNNAVSNYYDDATKQKSNILASSIADLIYKDLEDNLPYMVDGKLVCDNPESFTNYLLSKKGDFKETVNLTKPLEINDLKADVWLNLQVKEDILTIVVNVNCQDKNDVYSGYQKDEYKLQEMEGFSWWKYEAT